MLNIANPLGYKFTGDFQPPMLIRLTMVLNVSASAVVAQRAVEVTQSCGGTIY